MNNSISTRKPVDLSLYNQPVTLEGDIVRLEPLSFAHLRDLSLVGCEEEIWKLMVYELVRTERDMRVWMEELLQRQEQGTDLPFAVIHKETGRAIGATRYLEMRPPHRSLEIGGTWYGLDYQRTGVNTECKYLLLKYAFEVLGCIRVQFKTDTRNERSARAIRRIGAVQEGLLRNHYILRDGVIRDSLYFSILDSEWPQVRQKLEGLLQGTV